MKAKSTKREKGKEQETHTHIKHKKWLLAIRAKQ